jgi:formylglycine-generating enzyme required for sulfatase activity
LSRKTGKPYRLLSEAEWEYAARAGTTTQYYWGDALSVGSANCIGCGSRWDGAQTAPVGSFKPNSFGLHDMLGNVSQWIADAYHPNYAGAPFDGSVWSGGDTLLRVKRGGSWGVRASYLASSIRYRDKAEGSNNNTGFRVARVVTR